MTINSICLFLYLFFSAHTSSSPHHISAKEKVSVKTPEHATGFEEFMIAADLTLYANPLRCLVKKSTPTQNMANDKALVVTQAKDSGDIIAADLTKYGSPLDDKN